MATLLITARCHVSWIRHHINLQSDYLLRKCVRRSRGTERLYGFIERQGRSPEVELARAQMRQVDITGATPRVLRSQGWSVWCHHHLSHRTCAWLTTAWGSVCRMSGWPPAFWRRILSANSDLGACAFERKAAL